MLSSDEEKGREEEEEEEDEDERANAGSGCQEGRGGCLPCKRSLIRLQKRRGVELFDPCNLAGHSRCGYAHAQNNTAIIVSCTGTR